MFFFALLSIENDDDRSFVADVYDKYHNKLYRYALSKTNNHHASLEITQDTFIAFISNLDNKPMLNIWTPLHDSAAILCETFLVRNRGFVYGNSNKDICVPEHDSIRKTWKIQFDHFHLHRMDNPFSLSKVRDIHVMFGPPLEIHDFI